MSLTLYYGVKSIRKVTCSLEQVTPCRVSKLKLVKICNLWSGMSIRYDKTRLAFNCMHCTDYTDSGTNRFLKGSEGNAVQ